MWLVEEAGLHPKAGETTLRIAHDMAERMDFTAGTVLYDLDGTAARCALSRATVKRHVGYLRELGALVWVRHGSRRNLRLPGRPYAGTATVYAATVPYVYDRAHGNRIDGRGFRARVIGMPVPTADNSATGRQDRRGREPQSLRAHPRTRTADGEERCNDTPRRRARPRTASRPGNSTPRSPLQVAADIRIAAQVRPHLPWAQSEGLRRLAHALRPLIDQGVDAHDIAAELTSWWISWRPARPAAYITAQLRDRMAIAPREALPADVHAHTAGPPENAAWQAWLRQRAAASELREPQRTDEDRRHARLYGWDNWTEIADHYATDPDDALDLYGTRLCGYAVKRASDGWRGP
ncbi:cell wall protein [Streptomyces sp. NPDC059651]|uniref:cell wall protein n=1 Tax=Streptomyces sp. NPDC059651 TaxID=3346897 RepID=UPI003687A04B